MLDPEKLRYDEKGMIPAVLVDSASKRVLSLACMNRESLQISMERERVCVWSRSRQKIHVKGEGSGNYLHIVSITANSNMNALEIVVQPDDPDYREGTGFTFEHPVFESRTRHSFSLHRLMEILSERDVERPEGSYTTYLFEKGLDTILKKVGEESTEAILAAKNRDKTGTVHEIADLVYHVMVLMTESNISLRDVHKELESRYCIDHKDNQEHSKR